MCTENKRRVQKEAKETVGIYLSILFAQNPFVCDLTVLFDEGISSATTYPTEQVCNTGWAYTNSDVKHGITCSSMPFVTSPITLLLTRFNS